MKTKRNWNLAGELTRWLFVAALLAPSPRGRESQFSRDVAVHRAMDLAGNSGTCFHQPSLPVVTMGRSTVGAGPCEIGDQERLGAGRVETAAAAFPA